VKFSHCSESLGCFIRALLGLAMRCPVTKTAAGRPSGRRPFIALLQTLSRHPSARYRHPPTPFDPAEGG
jgi:hypothetical protein